MGQAKTLTEAELKRVLVSVTAYKHAARNRAMLMVTYLAGLRVGEVAALRYSDLVAADGAIVAEFTLASDQTKGGRVRTVFISERLRKELAAYLRTIGCREEDHPFFSTQKRKGFSANTLCQHFHWMFKRAGVQGASSHSGRRTFITNLASKGVGVRVLASLAGHRSIATTQAYIDVNDDMKRRAVELV